MIFDEEDRRNFYATTVRIPDHLLRDWIGEIEALTSHETAAGYANAILEDFCVRSELGLEQSTVTIDWLRRSIRRMQAGDDPSEVLRLFRRPKHRPPESGLLGFKITWWVRITTERGYSLKEAKDRAASEFGKDLKSIERYRREFGPKIANADTNAKWIAHFRAIGHPIPERRR